MIYDFYCKNCGKRRQVEIRLADYDTEKDRQKCPKCGEKIERVIEWQGYASGSGDGWCGKSSGNTI